MKYSEFLSHPLNRSEKLYGLVWLCFETLLFAGILRFLNTLLPAPLPQSEVHFLFFLGNFAAVVILFRRYLLEQVKRIPDTLWKSLPIAGVGFLAYMLFNFLTSQAFLALDPSFSSINDVAVRDLVAENYGLMFFGTVILVPIAEECLFRGLVFRGLYDYNKVLAWVVSVALFSSIHIVSYVGVHPFPTLLLCFLQYIPAGVCLAGSYRLSGSLLAPILIHTLVNLVGMVALR
jgi:membrane protease YdiL (CAAX protease family)